MIFNSRGLRCSSLRSLHVEPVRVQKGLVQQMTDTGFVEIRHLATLEHVRLEKCFTLSDHAAASMLVRLRRLKHLDLSGCLQIGDGAMKSIRQSNCPLVDLCMSSTSVSDVGLESLCGVGADFGAAASTLKRLDLSSCRKLTVVGVRFLSSITNLEVLNMTGSVLHDTSDIEHLAPTLTSLNVTAWRRFSLERVATFRNLRELCVQAVGTVSDAALCNLRGLHELRVLSLSWSSGLITDDGFGIVCQQCPLMTTLTLCGTDITDASLRRMARDMKQLELLDLSYCVGVTDSGVRDLTSLEGLRSLHLRACVGIRASSEACLHMMPALQTLVLAGVKCESCEDLAKLGRHRTLQRLDVSAVQAMTNTDVGHLACITQLLELNLGLCFRIDDASVECLSRLPLLAVLDISGTSISLDGAASLAKRLPMCQVKCY